MNEIKHTPQLPALESAPTNDTSALTCYALDWRELSHQHQAEVVRLRQINAQLVAALEDASFLLAQIGKFPGDIHQFMDSIIRSVQDARAALAKANQTAA